MGPRGHGILASAAPGARSLLAHADPGPPCTRSLARRRGGRPVQPVAARWTSRRPRPPAKGPKTCPEGVETSHSAARDSGHPVRPAPMTWPKRTIPRREQRHRVKVPTVAQAEQYLARGAARRPGLWVPHSVHVARAARALAERLPGLVPESA